MESRPFVPNPDPIHPDHADWFMWEAIYADGGTLPEVAGDRLHHAADIDRERVVAIILHPLAAHLTAHAMRLQPGEAFHLARRRKINARLDDGELIQEGEGLGQQMAWTILGVGHLDPDEYWRWVYLFVADDGSSFMSSDLNAV